MKNLHNRTYKNTRLMIATLLIFVACSVKALGESSVIKSPNDMREYVHLTLKNDMQVMVVSDPSIATSALSLNVGVGSFEDPETQQGLAHYLEHMIFMGSQKHPEPNALKAYVEKNGGQTNAFTTAQNTTYFFNVNSKRFEIAIGLLSDAIKSPIFDISMSERELKAIDSEWQRQRQTDQFTASRVFGLTANPNHPISKLSVGNLQTLSDKPNSMLHEELVTFYEQYYSSNIMKLVLVGSQSTKELIQLATKYFSSIPNKKIARPQTQQLALRQNETSKEIFLKTKVKGDSLLLQWPLEDNFDQWPYQVNPYINYLLSSEQLGTLIPSLRRAGLIHSMTAFILPKAYGADGSINLSFDLTSKGKENESAIIASAFKYIRLIKENGIQQYYADEIKHILDLQFQNYQAPPPTNLAVGISQSLFDVPADIVIRAPTLFEQFKPKAIEHVLSQVTEDNIRIWHIGETMQATKPLKYADGHYRVEPIDDSLKSQWRKSNLVLLLPQRSLPSTKEQRTVVANKAYFTPQLVLEKKGVRAFLGHSQYHQALDGLLYLKFLTPISNESPENFVSSILLTNLFVKNNRDFIQQAAIKFDVEINIRADNNANLVIAFGGQTQPQSELVEHLIESYRTFYFTEEELAQQIKPYQDSLISATESNITSQLVSIQSQTLKIGADLFTISEKLAALKKIDKRYLESLRKQLLTSTFIDTFAFGNYDNKQVSSIALSTRQTLSSTTQLEPWHYNSDYVVESGKSDSIKKQINQRNIGLLDTYIYPQKSQKALVQLTLLNQFLSTPLFTDLRTNKQMGYAVQTSVNKVHRYPALSIYIESNNTNLTQIKEALDAFFSDFESHLKELDKTSIEQLKVALIDNLTKMPAHVYAEAYQYLDDWENNELQFSTIEKQIEHIRSTTKEDLINLYKSLLIDSDNENLSIQLKGTDFSASKFY